MINWGLWLILLPDAIFFDQKPDTVGACLRICFKVFTYSTAFVLQLLDGRPLIYVFLTIAGSSSGGLRTRA